MTRPGRPAKTIPHEAVLDVSLWMNANMATHQGMPSKLEHLQMIVLALVMRLQQEDPALATHCIHAVHTIANLECCRYASDDRIKLEVLKGIQAIIDGKVRRHTHFPDSLQLQRKGLLDYFRANAYPVAANNPATRKQWLEKHWPTLMEILTPVQCTCPRYNTVFNDLAHTAKLNKTTISSYRTPSDAAELVLAHLHNLSPGQLRKLLKTPQ